MRGRDFWRIVPKSRPTHRIARRLHCDPVFPVLRWANFPTPDLLYWFIITAIFIKESSILWILYSPGYSIYLMSRDPDLAGICYLLVYLFTMGTWVLHTDHSRPVFPGACMFYGRSTYPNLLAVFYARIAPRPNTLSLRNYFLRFVSLLTS